MGRAKGKNSRRGRTKTGMRGGLGEIGQELREIDPLVPERLVEQAEKPVSMPGKQRRRTKEAPRPLHRK